MESPTAVLNATSIAAPTFMETYHNVIASRTDLSTIEQLWASYYAYMGNDILATGIMFFLFHEVLYFGRSLPWYIIDHIPYFRKYKIQDNKIISDAEQLECLVEVLKSHFLVEAIPIWLFHPLCNIVGIQVGVPFPAWSTILTQIAIFFVLEDAWHYTFHRLFHYGPFYKYIHKQHHKYAAPFGMTAEYAHPVEVAALGFGTVGLPVIYGYFSQNLHLFTVCLWVAGRLFQAVDAHSGYEFPWSLHHFLPFWAGADHHDLHHHYFIGNYASSFRWWDYLLDTEAGPEAKKEREERMKAKAAAKAAKAKKNL